MSRAHQSDLESSDRMSTTYARCPVLNVKWTNNRSFNGEVRGKCGGAQPINRPTAEPRLSTPRDCQKFAEQVLHVRHWKQPWPCRTLQRSSSLVSLEPLELFYILTNAPRAARDLAHPPGVAPRDCSFACSACAIYKAVPQCSRKGVCLTCASFAH